MTRRCTCTPFEICDACERRAEARVDERDAEVASEQECLDAADREARW